MRNQHVFAVINDSAFAFLSYRFIVDAGVPLIDGGYGGTYYGSPGNEQVISASGNSAPVFGVAYDLQPKIAKSLGATKMASIGYGNSAASSAATKANSAYAVPAAGMEAAYTNTSIDFGTTDVAPLVLGIKNSGADSAYYLMDANTNLAVAEGLRQSGVKLKAEIMATGYGQALLDAPSSSQIGPEVIFITQGFAPIEAKTKATKEFQADLKKYSDFTGVPDFGVYTGYIDCDLAILGLQQQGKKLDQSTFADDLRGLGTFNGGGGLNCLDTDISAAGYGKPPPKQCAWAMRLKDGKFVVVRPKDGKTPYWIGNLVGKSVTTPPTTAGG